jgi:uncharacterized protein (DUF1778 family)
LRGRSRTDFVRDAAVQAAEEVLLERALIAMNPKGLAAFMAAVSAPALPVPAMVEVLTRQPPWSAPRRKA